MSAKVRVCGTAAWCRSAGSSPVLDEERLLCSNCFARTTRPRIYYGWSRSPSRDGDDDDGTRCSSWLMISRRSLGAAWVRRASLS
jgi:hypothetical protein